MSPVMPPIKAHTDLAAGLVDLETMLLTTRRRLEEAEHLAASLRVACPRPVEVERLKLIPPAGEMVQT